VPAIIISPFAKKGFVDHTVYDTTSILKFIETQWGLQPVSTRDAGATDLVNAFQFTAAPTPGMPTTGAPGDLWPLGGAALLLLGAGWALRRRPA
jgi:MYXO-CTERM domain-containing protein